MAFRKYEKIARLHSAEAQGILQGEVYVGPKLDGTNASVWVDTKGELQFGSRNRHLGIGDDNAGFLHGNKDSLRLRDYFCEFPHHRLYGEWLVPHTIKGYTDDAWKRFYVYDVHDGTRFLTPKEWEEAVGRHEIDYIFHNLLHDPTMEEVEATLQLLSKKYMKVGEIGEGIVLKNFGFINKFGELKYAKYINEGFQNRPKKVAHDCPVEEAIADALVTEGLVHKTAAKILSASGTVSWDRAKMIPRLLETVFHDIVEEKLYSKLLEMKLPVVNFKILRGLICRNIKAVGEEYFQWR